MKAIFLLCLALTVDAIPGENESQPTLNLTLIRNTTYPTKIDNNVTQHSNFPSIFTVTSFTDKEPAKILLVQSGVLPKHHQPITVANIGIVPVQGESKYGTAVMWHGVANSMEILPGETKIFPMPNRFFLTGVKINATGKGRAIIYAERGINPMGIISSDDHHKNKPKFDHEAIEITRDLVTRVTEKIPIAGMFLATFIDVFFADEKEDPWDEVRDKVKLMIEHNKLQIINDILEKDIAPLKSKITFVMSQKDEPDFRLKFIDLILNLIDFDEKFIFKHGEDVHEVNYYVLPLYSRTVNMMLSFYSWGIMYRKQLGLNDNDVKVLTSHRAQTIRRAKEHIMNMYRDRVADTYNSLNVDHFYDSLMKTRTYIVVHGLEYIPYWDNILDSEKYPIVYQNFIAYSEYFGRQSINMNKQAMVEFGNEPLTPSLVKATDNTGLDTRNELSRVEIYLDHDKHETLVGVKLIFANNATYMMGQGGLRMEVFELRNNTRIMQIEAGGSGNLDNLSFHLSDGRILRYGKLYDASRKVFEMYNHYICSFYVANDVKRSWNQLQNIAVSYRLLPVETLKNKLIVSNNATKTA